jgi:microcompartment protein CcmL/EutN
MIGDSCLMLQSQYHMPFALGLIETNGLVAALEAADAMLKAANVRLLSKEQTNPALITMQIIGDVAAVQAAVDAGAAAASRVGLVVATHVIPSPDENLNSIVPGIVGEYNIPPDPVEVEASEETPEEVAELPETEVRAAAPEDEAVETPEEMVVADEIAEPVDDEPEYQTEIEEEEPFAPEIHSVGEEEIEEESSSETVTDEIVDLPELPQPPEATIEDEIAPTDEVIPDKEATASRKKTKEKDTLPFQDSLFSVPSLFDENSVPEETGQDEASAEFPEPVFEDEDSDFEEEIVYETDADIAAEDVVAEEPEEETIEVETPEIDQSIQEIPAAEMSAAEEETVTPQQKPLSPVIDEEAEALREKDILTLNVHQLRRLARHTDNFPIVGRDISKANRQELLYYFDSLKNSSGNS